jgi:hypothetical protein
MSLGIKDVTGYPLDTDCKPYFQLTFSWSRMWPHFGFRDWALNAWRGSNCGGSRLYVGVMLFGLAAHLDFGYPTRRTPRTYPKTNNLPAEYVKRLNALTQCLTTISQLPATDLPALLDAIDRRDAELKGLHS